jgi:transcriptional regulator with PAS, ATPase and Fis domain
MRGAMTKHHWVQEFPAAITVVDTEGVILGMNAKSSEAFAADGGAELIGKNSLDCHPEPARSKMQLLLAEQRANIYTTEKAGVKKLIAQIPWYCDGRFAGLVELAIEIPAEMPHFVRD